MGRGREREAPELPGDQAEFVALADGRSSPTTTSRTTPLTPLADALESDGRGAVPRARAAQEGDIWAVAAIRVNVVEVPEDVPGDKIDLAVNDGERTCSSTTVESTSSKLPSLEAFAAAAIRLVRPRAQAAWTTRSGRSRYSPSEPIP